MARSATSASMAKLVSWSEKHKSSILVPCFSNCCALVSMPAKDTSMPLTEYGSSTSAVEFFASTSILGPPGNPKPASLANLSKMFPRPLSNVSPKMRILPPANAMTCVLGPETYM